MAQKTATISITIDEPSASTPTTESITFTYEEENDFFESCDIEYLSEGSGGPIMRPKNAPRGL